MNFLDRDNVLFRNIGRITLVSFGLTFFLFWIVAPVSGGLISLLGSFALLVSILFLILYLRSKESILILSTLIGCIVGFIVMLLLLYIVEMYKGKGYGDGIGLFGMLIIMPSAALLGLIWGIERKFHEKNALSLILTITWVVILAILLIMDLG